jgi:hypothetical protein
LAGTYALRLGASDGPERPLVQALTNLVVPAAAVAVPPTLRVEGSLRLAEGTAFGLQLRLDRSAAAELTLRWTLNPRRDSAESLLPSRTGLVRIAAGAEGALLSLPSRDDGLLLGDQELELVLESLSGAVQLPESPTTLTLLDNDSSPLLLTSRWLNGRELELIYQPGPLASQGTGLMVRLSDPLSGELLENASVVSVFQDGWMGDSREEGSLQLSWSDPLAAGWPGTATVSLARLRFAGVDAASSPAIRIEASAGENQLVRWNNIAWQAPPQLPFLEELRSRLGGSFAGVQVEPSLAGALTVSPEGNGHILDRRALLERRYGPEPTLSLRRNGETIRLDLTSLIPGDRGVLQLTGTDWAVLPTEAHESSPQEQASQAMLLRSPGGDSNLNNLSLLSLSTAARHAIQQQAAGRDPLFGQLSFQLSGIAPGSLQKVEVNLPGEGLLDPVLLKQAKTGPWQSFDYDPITGTGAIFHDDDNDGSKERAVLWIRDGGRGDDDGLANGIILDPVVFAGTLPAPILRVIGDQLQRNEGNTGSTLFTFTVSRAGDLDRQSSADWTISGSGASPAAATDFSSAVFSSGSVQFVAGEGQITITVEVIGDTIIESDEEFTLSLSDSTGASIDPAASSATALIKNDDLHSITLVAAPGLLSEDETNNIIYTFTRTGPTTTSLSVSYVVGGTATLGTDYTGIAPTSATKTVSFAAGSSTATVTVDPTADVEIEPDETVALTLAAGNGYSIGTTAAVVGTILNDDMLVEAQGNTKLLNRGDGKAFVEVGGARQEITSPWGSQAGNDSTEWQMIAADTISGVNQILWRNNVSSFLHIWNLDANWTLQSASGSDAFNSARASELETIFQVDATRDGIIGSPFTTIEALGNTKLLKRSDGKAFVEVGGVRQEITSPWGSQAGNDSSEWQMIAADTISGANKILWRNNTSSFLHIWNLDANWSLQSASGSDAFNSARAWELETSFQMDANRDGIIGSPFTTIEAQGNTKLLKHSDGKAFVEVGTARQEITSPWGSRAGDDSSEWQMLAADTIGAVNQILWRNNTSSFLNIWNLDANWSLQSTNGSDAFNSARAWELETSFQMDANRDGMIGSPFTTIEAQGNTKLLKRSDGKAFVEVGGARQEITSPWGNTAGSDSSEWQMLAADTISGVNTILWRNNTSSFLHIWNLDANWTLQSTSGFDAFNTPRAWELETSFQVDGTRDGIIGNPYTTLETQGNTKLLRRADGMAFVEVAGTRQEISAPWGVSTTGSDSSEWQMLAAETISGNNQILWRNNASSFLHIWNLDANWTLQSASGADGFNTPRAWELETSFQVDATRDGIIGAPFTSGTL